MKKVIIGMVLAGLNLSGAVEALAAPVDVTGDVAVKYEKDTAQGETDQSGTMITFRLKGEAQLGAGWSVYARLGAQQATQPLLSDYNTETYGENKKSVVALDQFGFNFRADNFSYKLGRQDVIVGTTALLYSRSDSNMGKHVFVDGISATGKAGVIDLSALLAREDNQGSSKNKIYAIRAGYTPTECLNYGVTLGRYHYDGGEDTDHWAVDGTYKSGKNSWTVEYTKSNSNVNNKAYAGSWNYDFDDRNGIYITGFRVEANGDMGQQSDFDNDNRGIYYGITHKLSETEALELTYKDQKKISTGQNSTKLEAAFTHSF